MARARLARAATRFRDGRTTEALADLDDAVDAGLVSLDLAEAEGGLYQAGGEAFAEWLRERRGG